LISAALWCSWSLIGSPSTDAPRWRDQTLRGRRSLHRRSLYVDP
jgi:hypothetical protein